MSLLILVPSAILGGHEFQSIKLINQIYKQELIYRSIVECGNPELLEKIEADNKHYYNFPQVKLINSFFKTRTIKEYLKERICINNVDRVMICGGTIETIIIYSHIIKSINSQIETIGYVPMVVDKRILRPYLGLFHNLVLKIACFNIDRIVTINRLQGHLVKKFYGKNSAILPNIIDEMQVVKRNYGQRLVYCGRLDDTQKNIINLIDLLDNQANPYKEFVIIGSGPEEHKISRLSADTKHIHIKMLGWLSAQELESALGCNDVLIMNSRWEGEPLVVREFSARGIPVVARNIPGMRGVTFSKYRFNTPSELLDILKKNFGAFEVKPQQAKSRISRMREKVVNCLITRSAHGNS